MIDKTRSFCVGEKDWLYRKLLEQSGLKEKAKGLMELYRELLLDIYKTHIAKPNFLELFEKSRRICKTGMTVNVSGADLGLIPNNSKDEYFPNALITRDDWDPEKKLKITTRITIYFEDDYPKVKDLQYFGEDVLNKGNYNVPSEKLDALRNLHIDILNVNYDIENFLIEEFPSRCKWKHFLHYVATWGMLYRINPEWYELVSKAFKGSDKVVMEDNIPESLQNLRNFIGDLGVDLGEG